MDHNLGLIMISNLTKNTLTEVSAMNLANNCNKKMQNPNRGPTASQFKDMVKTDNCLLVMKHSNCS